MCDKIEGNDPEQRDCGRGTSDRPGDPIFPLIPRVLEALRARHASQEGTAPGDEYAMLVETICGAADDSQPVEQYNGALGVTNAFVGAHQRPVGQIQWNDDLASKYTNPGNVNGVRWCSGTLISADLFLTAGHCFDQTGGGWQRPRTNGMSNIISSAEIAQNMHVNFNYQVDPSGGLRPEVRFPILQLVEYRLGNLDFAIVRLGGNPGATFGTTQLATSDAVAGDTLAIIGHPAGLPKRIEAGPALPPSGNLIRYDDIDTLGGNSGSGVLRASDGRIVGVHTNGGCSPSSPNGTDANYGQRIVALLAASPTLRRLSRTIHTLQSFDTGHGADPGTPRALDQLGTLRVLDVGGTLKFRDDVKLAALDKSPGGDVKLGALDGNPLVNPSDPVVNPAGGLRPFVLAQPHHSMAWSGAGVELNERMAALQQLAEIIGQYEEALQQLVAQYELLQAEIERVCGAQE